MSMLFSYKDGFTKGASPFEVLNNYFWKNCVGLKKNTEILVKTKN